MGGRGALSGIGEKLPTAFNPPLGAWQLPTLSGTEKQVNWAEKIREQVLNEIEAYTSTRNSDGRMSRLYDVYYDGEKAMKKYLKSFDEDSYSTAEARIQAKKRAVKSFHDVKTRLDRLYKIEQISSAKWWIDNRPNERKNLFNRKLKAFIDGQVKEL